MEKEDAEFVSRVGSAASALALWLVGELEPSTEATLTTDVDTMMAFVHELAVHLSVRKASDRK